MAAARRAKGVLPQLKTLATSSTQTNAKALKTISPRAGA
jgi:hypothetical protein